MNQTLFTAWHSHVSPEGGRILFGYVTWAANEAQMREKLSSNVHIGWGEVARIAPGVLRNEETEQLWGATLLERFEQCERDESYISATAKLLLNRGSLESIPEPEMDFDRLHRQQREREVEEMLKKGVALSVAVGLLVGLISVLWDSFLRTKLLR